LNRRWVAEEKPQAPGHAIGLLTRQPAQLLGGNVLAMGELQHATIEHVFEMRAVLTPDQQQRFDDIVRTELLRASDEGDSD
jgi:hypothetical protein